MLVNAFFVFNDCLTSFLHNKIFLAVLQPQMKSFHCIVLGNITVTVSNTRSLSRLLHIFFLLFAKDKCRRYNGLKVSIVVSSSPFLRLVKRTALNFFPRYFES